LETYIREVSELIHLTINAELITTTLDHPFYVLNTGFVSAGELHVGSEVINSQGEVLTVEDIRYEAVQTPVTVYNFQVEDFHTYHVGLTGVLVHNANYIEEKRVPIDRETVLGDKDRFTRTNRRESGATVYKGSDGNNYHRDTLHVGEGAQLEVYNGRGVHIGIADPLTGEIKPGTAVSGRRIDV